MPKMAKTKIVKKRKRTVATKRVASKGIGQELKSVDPQIAQLQYISATLTDNASIYCMNAIRAGPGPFERIGRKIRMKRLMLNFDFVYEYKGSATLNEVDANYIRLFVVLDTQPQAGAPPVYSTIFSQVDVVGITTTSPTSLIADGSRTRFKILYDKLISFNPDIYSTLSGGSSNMCTKNYRFRKTFYLKGIETTYQTVSNSPPVYGEILQNALLVGFKAGVNDPLSNVCIQNQMSSRLEYYD